MFCCENGSFFSVRFRQIENEWVAAVTGDDHEMSRPILDRSLFDGVDGIPVLSFDQFSGSKEVKRVVEPPALHYHLDRRKSCKEVEIERRQLPTCLKSSNLLWISRCQPIRWICQVLMFV